MYEDTSKRLGFCGSTLVVGGLYFAVEGEVSGTLSM
jgi:hypothetical protein